MTQHKLSVVIMGEEYEPWDSLRLRHFKSNAYLVSGIVIKRYKVDHVKWVFTIRRN